MAAELAGALGSLGFTVYMGRRNPSAILIALFVLWVLSPFAGLAYAHSISKGWAYVTRVILSSVAFVVSASALAVYRYITLGPPRPKVAFWFLIVPLASWLLIGLALSAAAAVARRRPRNGDVR